MTIPIDKLKNHLKSFSFLLLLLPIFFISGPFLPDLTISVMAIFGLFYFLKNKICLINKNFFVFFLFFYFYLILISIISPIFPKPFESSLFFIRYLFFFITVTIILYKYQSNDFNYMGIFFLIILSVLFFDSSLQFITNKNILGYEKFHPIRVSSFFGDELILGAFISKFIPIVLSVLALSNINKKLLLSLISLILAFIIILLSAERTALFIFSLFLLLLSFKPIINIKTKLILFSFILILFTALIFSKNNLKDRIISLSLNQITHSNAFNFFSPQHTSHFMTGYYIFLDNKIFGAGPKSFRYLCSDSKYNFKIRSITMQKFKYFDANSCSTHPHNYAIQLLSETGLIGFILFLSFYFWLIYIFITKREVSLSIISAGLISMFFPLIPSNNFFNNWNIGLISFNLAFMLYIHMIHSNKNADL